MPLCLGMADELREAGNMSARDIFGLPLLLVRDREGEIRIRLNVRRHRSARLALDENEVCSSLREQVTLAQRGRCQSTGLDDPRRSVIRR